MKVAILGGSGFLGKYVVEEAINNGIEPVIFSRSSKKNDKYECRVTDYSKEDLALKLNDIEAVIHLAAKRGSQGRIDEFHANEVLTQNLYEACYENNIKNIVYASTISVYSDINNLPWNEEQLVSPSLMYGVSKLACEYIGQIYSKNKGLNIKNIRLAHLYGFNEKNNYMINLFMRQAFNKNQLVINNKSVAKREFLYAKDAASAIILALNKKELSGVFNVGSEERLTNYEVAKSINSIFGNSKEVFIKNHNIEETIESSYMSSEKAKNIIGFSPKYTFNQAMNEIYLLMKELDNVPIFY
ncbi:NAD-dependent epimerase/dehydratase family protein [Clostridium perfringens]|uniref:NAD-dependent epimerase/dehydratase family protein n=1 Tax=Clostridium perfringens TaxID=1502 RepID=UPI0018E4078F|nr:NAD(P)-dependent oxidoreductase [Clostridium perfringens]MBI6027016.1 NAD(P)-dependent oxidoreductase [Clostridium perfringens]